MNKFEQHLKSSLESYQPEFNAADWADMNSRLDKVQSAAKGGSKGWLAAAAIAVIAGGALTYYLVQQPAVQPVAPVVAEKSEQPVAGHLNAPGQNSQTQEVSTSPSSTASGVSETNISSQSNDKKSTAASPSANNSQPTNLSSPSPASAAVEQKNSQVEKQPVSQQPVQTEPAPATPAAFTASFTMDANKVCEGGTVQFKAMFTAPGATYKWFFGDGTTSNEQNPKHLYKESGNFTVKLKVSHSGDFKTVEEKMPLTVAAAPSIDYSFRSNADNPLMIEFSTDAQKGVELKWDFGDKRTSSDAEPSHVYARYGTYPATLTARNSAGCVQTIKKDVKVEYKLYAPNAFSPNADGRNDSWMPSFDDDSQFTLNIYDASNQLVYSTSDRNDAWDGMNKRTGMNAKEGEIYTWKAVVKDKNGVESNHAGRLMIVK